MEIIRTESLQEIDRILKDAGYVLISDSAWLRVYQNGSKKIIVKR